MKRLEFGEVWIFLFIFFLSMVCFAPQAFSYDLAVGDHVKLLDGPGTTNGGEFKVYDFITNDYLFDTFCLEKNEYFSFVQELVISDISTGARNGGVDGQETPNFDPLDPRTAYLYYHFILGDLAGYDYGAGRVNSANDLQRAIWFLEQEITGQESNPYVILANSAVQSGHWSGIGDVRVLNLVDTEGKVTQDQLYVPSPEPATMLLFGSGLIGLAGLGRRKMLKKKG